MNQPGFAYYNLNGLLLAAPCLANTYSPGFRKQIACVPCPPGAWTRNSHSSSSCGAALAQMLWLGCIGLVTWCDAGRSACVLRQQQQQLASE